MKDESEKTVRDLRKLREMRGWTQRQVADRLDLPDVRTVRRWERGEVYPSLRYRMALCTLFEIDEEEFNALLSKKEPNDEKKQLPIQEESVSPPVVTEDVQKSHPDRYRQRLLEKVQAFWIKGVLERSLNDVPYLTIALCEAPEVVTTSWAPIIQQPERPMHLCSSSTNILQFYNDAGGELMILGAPGSGKTTLLLELARELLQRAQQDRHHPVPIILNLSSWSAKTDSFTTWLKDELRDKYHLPSHISTMWIEGDTILPLLDGLDEVDPAQQKRCMDAIIEYRQQHGFEPMVICCREDIYKNLQKRMLLQQAVCVQPLTTQQIDEYLTRTGGIYLQHLLSQDVALQELITTPLMLHVLTLSYQDQTAEINTEYNLQEKWDQHLFALYTQHMLSRRKPQQRYSYQECMRWLSWIARQMKRRYQTEFYLERLQLESLADLREQQLCQGLSAGLWSGLLIGVLIGCIDVPLDGVVYGLVIAPCLALVVAIATGILGTKFEYLLPTAVKKVSFGSLIGAAVGGICIWLNNYCHGNDILIGAVGGLAIVVTFVMLSLKRTAIQPTEVVTWSWEKLKQSFSSFLLIGIILIAVIGFAGGLFGWYVADLGVGMIVVLLFGIISILIVGILSGLSGRMLDERLLEHPNQGIHRSALHALQSGFIAGLFNWCLLSFVSLLILRFFPGLVIRTNFLVFGKLAFALMLGLGVAIYEGGDACVKHFLLRFMLWRRKCIPWNYTRFLDYSVEHLVLRKVGAGYIFVHRLLLDYFSSLNSELID